MKKIIIMLFLGYLMLPVGVQATNKQDVKLKFYLTTKDKYQYTVEVKGQGYVSDNRKTIREGSMTYSLAVGDVKEFKVYPKLGYEIEYIKYDGEEITLKENKVIIKAVSANRKLKIKFKKKEVFKGDKPGISGNPKPDTKGNASELSNQKVNTGELNRRNDLIMIILSGMLIVGLLKKKHIKH